MLKVKKLHYSVKLVWCWNVVGLWPVSGGDTYQDLSVVIQTGIGSDSGRRGLHLLTHNTVCYHHPETQHSIETR